MLSASERLHGMHKALSFLDVLGLLDEVASQPVESMYLSNNYVTIQMDKDLWRQIQDLISVDYTDQTLAEDV